VAIKSAVLGILTTALLAHAEEPVPRLSLCMILRVPLQPGIQEALEKELREYGPALRVRIEMDCESQDTLPITIEARPLPGMPGDTLAAVPTRNGRIQPDVRVFYQAIQEMLPERSVRNLSRALALVIAHECHHYLLQEPEHDARGIGVYAFTGPDLQRGAKWWTRRTID
jgi:hypothetical protein